MEKDDEKSRPLYNTLTHPSCISCQASRVYILTVCAIFPQWWIKRPRTRGWNITHEFLYINYETQAEAPILLFNQLIKHWYHKIMIFVKRTLFAIDISFIDSREKATASKCFRNFLCAYRKLGAPSHRRRGKYIYLPSYGKHKRNRHLICNEWIRNYVRNNQQAIHKLHPAVSWVHSAKCMGIAVCERWLIKDSKIRPRNTRYSAAWYAAV